MLEPVSVVIDTTLGALGADVSTVCLDVVVAVNALPAVSVPVTVASNEVSAARSLPETATLKLPEPSTVPL